MNDRIKVLMLGPARSVKGGVSGVVNNLYDAGLGDKVSIKYISTMKDGSKLKKLLVAGIAYIRASLSMGRYDIVHINMACGASYYRKSLFIKMAIRKGKKLVIHQHGGDVEAFYKGTLKGAARQEMLRLLNSCSAFIVLADKFRDFFSDIIICYSTDLFCNIIGDGIRFKWEKGCSAQINELDFISFYTFENIFAEIADRIIIRLNQPFYR